VYSNVKQRSSQLVDEAGPALLANRRIGLEKECLRVTLAGAIASTDHPSCLGKALTHPSITTDFAEALLEMVTPPCDSAKEALHYLTTLHQFINSRLPEDELFWNTSMPCILNGADSIRIGEYGDSHQGRMKHAYRRGLGARYGKRMQAIAGIHFNFSMPENIWPLWQRLQGEDKPSSDSDDVLDQSRSRGYFHMMQNLMRIGWVVPFLFGASPAICRSFLARGEESDLDELNGSTLYAPYGTSLRMGKIGYRYRDDSPIDLSVRHTDIHAYIHDIIGHVTTEHPPYREQGVRDADGQYQQLSANRLQIENEYYGTVRPKQIPEKGELPILALKHRGVRYLELRSVDVNMFDPAGLSLEQVAMLELLMIFAWLGDAEALSADDMQRCSDNISTVAHYGRQPDLELKGPDGVAIKLKDWGLSILDSLSVVAEALDKHANDNLYVRALSVQINKFNDPDATPSAQVMRGIHDAGSFNAFAMKQSHSQGSSLDLMPVDENLDGGLVQAVAKSIADAAKLEAASKGSFDDYLHDIMSQLDPHAMVKREQEPLHGASVN